MATLDKILSPALQNYITHITEPENYLLAALQQETKTLPGAQMLCGPVEGALLNLLVSLSGAATCLELGTFTGYSALKIAEALPAHGKLITCEKEKQHAHIAQRYFNKSPHGYKIDLREGDALTTIETFTFSFDFIFIDADKTNYPLYYEKLLPRLKIGGLMVVDNTLWSGKILAPDDEQGRAIDSLNKKARTDERVKTVMLSVRDGILLIYKIKA